MGGGKYQPTRYVEGPDPYINQDEVVKEKDLGDYVNVPQEVVDKEGKLPTTTSSSVGAARGLKL